MSARKGQSLYDDGAIDIVEHDTVRQIAKFRAHGTMEYQVDVFYYSAPFRTSCTCPYNWGGICKHQVAALLYLKDELEQPSKEGATPSTPKPDVKKTQPSIPPIAPRKAGPFSIGKIKDLSNMLMEVKLSTHFKTLYGQIKNIEFKNNALSAQIHTSNQSWNYYGRNSNTVQLEVKKEEVWASCSCNLGRKQLCAHVPFLLKQLKSNYSEKLLWNLQPQYRNRIFEETAKTSGIPYGKIKSYFNFDIASGKLVPTASAKGLILFSEWNKSEIKSEVREGFLKKEHFSLGLPENVSDKQERVAYVIWFSGSGQIPGFIPISGKPGPDKSDLKYIKNHSIMSQALVMDDEDKYLLGFIERYMQLYNLTGGAIDNKKPDWIKNVHNKFIEIIQLLKTREYVFSMQDEEYNQNKNVKKSTLNRLNISEENAGLYFKLNEEGDIIQLNPILQMEKEGMSLEHFSNKKYRLTFSPFGYIFDQILWPFSNLNQGVAAYNFLDRTEGVMRVLNTQFDSFFEAVVGPIAKDFQVDISKLKTKTVDKKQLIPQQRQLYLSELSNFILFTPQMLYNDDIKANVLTDHSLVSNSGNELIYFQRDVEKEEAYVNFLRELHPDFSSQSYDEFFFLPLQKFIERSWFFDLFEKLEHEGIAVFGANDLQSVKYSSHRAKISTGISSGIDWFDINIELSFGDEQIKLSTLKKAIMRNERFVKLRDGKLGVLPEEWFQRLQKIFRSGEVSKDSVQVSKLRFNIVDELFDEISDVDIIKELREKRQRLQEFTEIKKIDIPKSIKAELRHYQVAGYNWMNFLDEFKWGGLLADDMGLGKTVQVLTFIRHQVELNDKPNLAVVPTSLLLNWENEIHKFAPDLKYHIYHGIDRKENYDTLKDQQLIITSYGVVANDIERLIEIDFNYIFLDESQAIKNITSKRYKACRLLKAENRVAMTGTPIENNTFDLYAQMNFVNPGFLGAINSFKENYSKLIDGAGDAVRASELQRMIAPFVLRRTKEQVAKELPPKVEDYIYCEMEESQRSVYNAFRNKYRDYLMNKIEEEGLNKSKMHVLEGLLKLRQICDSPALLPDNEDYGIESIKIKVLLKHIREKTSNHKILVFSQFVKMLTLIRKELDSEDITYEYLDGQCSPKQRNKSVNNFQENKDCRVFLISLKAGGTGLNLTAADYVYIVDPWWNPAVENQAIDRTHRIGQDKHIIAYRMICKDTVEEKIMQYQARKLKVASDVVQAEASFMKAISQDDIRDLFG